MPGTQITNGLRMNAKLREGAGMLTAAAYPRPMRTLFLLLILVMPTAVFAAHTGVPKIRTGPELSDIALFVMACIGVFLIRRAMRAKFRNKRKD